MSDQEPPQGSGFVPFETAKVWSDAEECRDTLCAIPGRHMHVPRTNAADAARAAYRRDVGSMRIVLDEAGTLTDKAMEAAQATLLREFVRSDAELEKARVDVDLVRQRARDRAEFSVALLEPLTHLAGEASMCWDPAPQGVFQTERAIAAAQRATSRVLEVLAVLGVAIAPADEMRDAQLGRDLVAILQCHAGERGDSEGAVQTLHRIVLERERLQRQLAELDPEVVKRVSAEMRKAAR